MSGKPQALEHMPAHKHNTHACSLSSMAGESNELRCETSENCSVTWDTRFTSKLRLLTFDCVAGLEADDADFSLTHTDWERVVWPRGVLTLTGTGLGMYGQAD